MPEPSRARGLPGHGILGDDPGVVDCGVSAVGPGARAQCCCGIVKQRPPGRAPEGVQDVLFQPDLLFKPTLWTTFSRFSKRKRNATLVCTADVRGGAATTTGEG